ncbi:hypothetical protein, conserved [Babesia ovata]|uniref:Uncharacterized protein n=1 Tax=Babesia ovata TaxID=189622 RepID=A0A2H6KHD5_9APIC|nr:uncharacterized protein BOVATA_038990 [Babesia ovata]GBE62406.1 hypothetical protein, conserved [Babesia ovata]
MVADHGVVLSTLKDCFQFLGWLNSNDDETVLEKVASELENRIDTCHKNPQFESEFRSSLIKFLDGISLVYHQISKEPSARTYDQKTAAQVAEAFHECLIKVHSALIYLLDIVSLSYDDACGGDRERFEELQDHELKEYLIFSNSDDFNGIITGGFGDGDLKNLRASKLAENIQNALGNLERLNDILGCNKRIKEDYKESDLPPANVPDIPIKPSSKVVPTKTGNAKPVIKSDGKHIRCDKNELAQSHGKMSEDAQNQRWDGSTFPYQDDDLFAVTDSDLPHYNQYLSGSPDGWHQAAVHSVDPEKLEAEKKVPVVPAKKHIPEDQPPKEKPPKVNEQPKDLASPPETLMPKEKSTSKIASAKRVATKSQATKNETSHPFKKSEEARDQGKYSDPDWDKLFDRIEQEDAYSYAGCAYESPQEPDGPGYPSPKVPAASPKVVPEKNVSTTPSKKPELTPVLFSGRPKKPEVPPAKVPVTKPTATKTEAVKPVLTKAKAAKPTATSTPLAQNPGKKSERGQDQSNEAESYRNQHDFEESDTYYASEDPNVHTLTDEQTGEGPPGSPESLPTKLTEFRKKALQAEESEGSPNLGKEVDALLDDYDVSIHEMTSDSPVPYSDVDLQEHAESGPQRSSLAEALGIPKEPVPQKHPPKVPPKNSDSPPLEASREYVPEKQSEGPQYQVEALDVDTDLNNGQGDLMPAYSPVDYTHFPQLPGNQGDQPNQGQQGDQPQQIQRNPELQNTTPALAAETGKNPAAVRLQPTTYYSGKKLTDCPTNLRESIDWIIQLKYGSGHGDGVDNLSEALDKLHRKLIADSFSNLLDQLSDLLDPWKTTPCCRRIHRAIRTIKIKLQHPRNIQRNHINGLLKQLEYNKEVCLQHHYIDSSKDEALKDVHSKMRDLAGVSRDINTSRNGLLHHLCDGVQILLGFDSSSKGYSGSGIVYSDLDRLCDGVMAFLYSVLKAVHDNENLWPYSAKLEGAVTKLYQHINKGKTDWHELIEIVKSGTVDWRQGSTGGIAGWLEAVKVTNDGVAGPLGKMMNKDDSPGSVDIPGLVEDAHNIVKKEYEEPKDEGFRSRWVGNLDKLIVKSKESSQNLNDLDLNLRNQLSPHVALINELVTVFVMSTKKDHEGLEEARENVSSEIEKLREEVNRVAEEQKGSCIRQLTEALKNNIHDPIAKVKRNLEDVKKSLENWTAAATRYVIEGLATASKVLAEVGKDGKNRLDVKSAVKRLKDVTEHYYVRLQQKGLEICCYQVKYTLDNLCTEVTKLVDFLFTEVLSGFGGGHVTRGEVRGRNVSEHLNLLTQVAHVVNGYAQSIGTFAGSSQPQHLEQLRISTQSVETITIQLQSMHQYSYSSSIIASHLQHLHTFVTTIKRTVNECINTMKSGIKTKLSEHNSDAFTSNATQVIASISRAVGSALSIGSEFALQLQTALKWNASEYQPRAQHPTSLRCFQGVSDSLRQLSQDVNAFSADISDLNVHIAECEKCVAEPLKKLLENISSAGKAIKQNLEELKKLIDGNGPGITPKDLERNLEKIRDEIDDIIGTSQSVTPNPPKTLEDIVTATKTFYEEALSNAVKMYIEQVTFTLQTQVTAKAKAIQKFALSQFAESKAQGLQQLKELVSAQKALIDGIIEEDKKSGLKGLMLHMYGGRYPYGIHPNHPLDNLRDALPRPAEGAEGQKNTEELKRFNTLSEKFKEYLGRILEHVNTDVMNVSPTEPTTGDVKKEESKESSQVAKIKDALDALLEHMGRPPLKKMYIFDNNFCNLREFLSDCLSSLSPYQFANPRHPELLDVVKKGLQGFAGELRQAYVNKYDGAARINWNERESSDGENCAKILWSIVRNFLFDFDALKDSCNGSWKGRKICLTVYDEKAKRAVDNPLGQWLRGRGFKVPKDENSQDAELNKERTGAQIYDRMCRTDTLYTYDKEVPGALYAYLLHYYKTCHRKYVPNPRPPTTVNEMLHWLCGVEWNSVYNKLKSYFGTFYDESTADYELGRKTLEVAISGRPSGTIHYAFERKLLNGIFNSVTLRAYDMLITILGHGHADGRYAVDFVTNPDNLLYPTDTKECFDLLVEILFRLDHQLRFLFKMCQNSSENAGWRDCHFGKGVGESRWPCNKLRCTEQDCGNKCTKYSSFGLKSPLQLFFEDRLPGFLPHQLTTSNGQIICQFYDHFGLPCKTPMGFRELDMTASRRQKGDHLRGILERFCGTGYAPGSLTLLCCSFRCLLNRPPQNLGEIFAFYQAYLESWKGGWQNVAQIRKHKETAFVDALRDANVGCSYAYFDPSNLFGSSGHGSDTHSTGDLLSIVKCESDAKDTCGQYVQSISFDISLMYASIYKELYLSWVVYVTETFYDLLKHLRDECCRKCESSGTGCHDKSCVKGCAAYTSSNHAIECTSIVKCPNALPTLYKYGFTFGSPYKLNGAKHYEGQKRTCKDFRSALENVIREKNVLHTFAHETIPKFLWAIRLPFFYTMVALWSIAALLIVYTLLCRLEILRIRSHLIRFKVSHLINVKALLTPRRKMLSLYKDVDYFDDDPLEVLLKAGLRLMVHVSEGVRAWLKSVEKKDGNVTMPLNDLENIVDGNMSVSMLCKRITDHVGNWEGTGGLHHEEAGKAERALGGIDKNVGDMISCKI